MGLDKDATYASYSYALQFLLDGAQLIGTNKDWILAKPNGFEMGNGSIVAMFEYATKQTSPDIAKPAYPILKYFLQHFDLHKEEILLVGDNLGTDILLGVENGIQPTYVVKDLMELLNFDFY